MRGLVLGGGLAGTLAAAALGVHCTQVTVVERDRYPDGPRHRKGVPQGKHTHTLMSGGVRTIEQLLPGTLDRLLAAGAQYIGVPNRLLSYMPGGWRPRDPELQFVIGTTRALLDWTIRRQLSGVEFLEGTEVVGLLGDATRITGARVRDRASGEFAQVHADFVVDATGRGSATATWLAALGLPAVTQEAQGPGIFYSSRVFRAPRGSEFAAVFIAPDPNVDRRLRSGVLLPVEDEQWLFTLTGVRDDEPPVDARGFTEYADGLSHPLLGQLMRRAEPLGDPFGFRIAANRRLRYDQLSRWPECFVVIGDAACEYNPVYGHGMTVAARNALAVREGLRHGVGAHAIQQDVTKAGLDAWQVATEVDTRLVGILENQPVDLLTRLRYRFADRMTRSSPTRPALNKARLDVFTLSVPTREAITARVIWEALLGPAGPPLAHPPLTPAEHAILHPTEPRPTGDESRSGERESRPGGDESRSGGDESR
ncbi:NAD(P)/FAD-dependent oxidoreductase [Kutzneria albida]|uniref:FAD-binding monooxygenase n=1 Tax=Kutzneria albida DSM 43870 TaxID=1449976 RepID=W5W3M3_9PSEU|nr:FAD-dependent monooxygenase [Kutzneria albida]AHH95380.1 FAD-binding monooxygenase [Kutzneria albida DSM 43870]